MIAKFDRIFLVLATVYSVWGQAVAVAQVERGGGDSRAVPAAHAGSSAALAPDLWGPEFWARNWIANPPPRGKANSDSIYAFLVWYDSVLARRDVANRRFVAELVQSARDSAVRAVADLQEQARQQVMAPRMLLLILGLLLLNTAAAVWMVVRAIRPIRGKAAVVESESSSTDSTPTDTEEGKKGGNMPGVRGAASSRIPVEDIVSPAEELQDKLKKIAEDLRAGHERGSLPDSRLKERFSREFSQIVEEFRSSVSQQCVEKFGWGLDARGGSEQQVTPLVRPTPPQVVLPERTMSDKYCEAASGPAFAQESWGGIAGLIACTLEIPSGGIGLTGNGHVIKVVQQRDGSYYLWSGKDGFELFPPFRIAKNMLNGLSYVYRYSRLPETATGYYRVKTLTSPALCRPDGDGWVLAEKGDLELVPAQG